MSCLEQHVYSSIYFIKFKAFKDCGLRLNGMPVNAMSRVRGLIVVVAEVEAAVVSSFWTIGSNILLLGDSLQLLKYDAAVWYFSTWTRD